MPDSIDTGALLARSYPLPSGMRVRLRLAHRSDLPALRALLARRGVEADDLALSQLVRYDPQRRIVLCAATPLGGSDALVGVGAIDLDGTDEPDSVVVDDRVSPELAQLLHAALAGRAQRIRHVA